MYSQHEELRPKEAEKAPDEDKDIEIEPVGETDTNAREEPRTAPTNEDTNTNNTNGAVQVPPKETVGENDSRSQHDEHNGDDLVENDEDAVIY